MLKKKQQKNELRDYFTHSLIFITVVQDWVGIPSLRVGLI